MDNGASSYRRFLDGDENGFVELVRDYKDGLILYINSFVGSLGVAEELAEDSFVKLGIKKPHFSGNASFKTWLYAVGRNVALDYIRKQARHPTLPLDECSEAAGEELLESAYIRDERRIVIHRAMNKLKPEYRQVLWLTYFEDMSNREAAAVLHKSLHATEVLLSRARQSLKKELEKEGFCYEDQ